MNIKDVKRKTTSIGITVALAAGVCVPAASAFAADTGMVDGVQDAGTGTAGSYVEQEYSTAMTNGATAAWTAQDGTLNTATEYGDGGAINLIYDTTAGTWQDPGADATDASDNTAHPNGTYQVTIPTLIKYTGMSIGLVNTSDTYNVNVRGAIPTGETVTLTAQTSQTLSTANGDGGITETTTQAKTTWSTDECFGTINADGSLSGTNCTDTIAMNGVAKAAGTYTGSVTYTSTCA